jgi:predicted metal-dependent peptidase
VFLWAHEVAHCAFGHPWRRDGRIFYWFNVAADFAINSILKAHGFVLPEGVLIDEKYAGRSSEWIYSRVVKRDENEDDDDGARVDQLPGDSDEDDDDGDDAQDGDDDAQDDESDDDAQDDAQDGEDAQDDGQDGAQGERPAPCGEVRDAPQGPTAECQEPMTEDDWKEAVESAILTASRMGKVGGLLKRTVGDLRKAKADWPALLRCFFTEAARSDYSFRRPRQDDGDLL